MSFGRCVNTEGTEDTESTERVRKGSPATEHHSGSFSCVPLVPLISFVLFAPAFSASSVSLNRAATVRERFDFDPAMRVEYESASLADASPLCFCMFSEYTVNSVNSV